jgi:deoxyribonuclease V
MDISSKDDYHFAAIAVMDMDGEPKETMSFKGRPGLPYIPGLLFYREAPLLLPLLGSALDEGIIDGKTLCVIDGNGTLHPRRMGIACQIGVCTGLRSCGVAKKLLTGKVSDPIGTENGNFLADVIEDGELIGSALSGADNSKPVYLSRGHRIDQATVNRILNRLRSTRIPEPTKRAHLLCNEARRSESPS